MHKKVKAQSNRSCDCVFYVIGAFEIGMANTVRDRSDYAYNFKKSQKQKQKQKKYTHFNLQSDHNKQTHLK